jgi:hypothetical protein
MKVKLKMPLGITIILPIILYGCETWSLTLREERGLRVFGNRVLRRMFGPKRIIRSLMFCTAQPIF